MDTNENINENKNSYSNRSFRYMLTGAAIMIATALITAVIFGQFIKRVNAVEEGNGRTYDQHFVFVGEDIDSELWDQVYEAARAQAEKDNIYLEDIKESLKVNYSNEDLLRVAINSNVDGIIYVGSSSANTIKLINSAVDKGIGVCVLHNDVDKSRRQCYVGVNNYELGQIYAQQILQMKEYDELLENRIALLASGDMSEGAANLVILGMEDYFDIAAAKAIGDTEDGQPATDDEVAGPEIEVIKIDAADTFSVEEDIRNIFVTDEKLPDIMICLENAYTQCVYQAVVDYNHVGEVNIIGYFANDDILDAIDKQIIYSAVSVDTEEMGKSSILAIEELNEFGYTNSFMPVSMEIIGQQEAKALLREAAREAEEEQ